MSVRPPKLVKIKGRDLYIVEYYECTLKKGLLPDLYPGEEPLKFRIDFRNLKTSENNFLGPFNLRKSIRNLKGSSSG